MLGGGMRQAGILAAAALYALDHNVERLVEDHRHAHLLGDALGRLPGLTVDLPQPSTNILMVDLGAGLPAGDAFSRQLAERGVLCLALGPRRLRLVTHLDVSTADCQRAAAVFSELVADVHVHVDVGEVGSGAKMGASS
jgi:threonine aldolase